MEDYLGKLRDPDFPIVGVEGLDLCDGLLRRWDSTHDESLRTAMEFMEVRMWAASPHLYALVYSRPEFQPNGVDPDGFHWLRRSMFPATYHRSKKR